MKNNYKILLPAVRMLLGVAISSLLSFPSAGQWLSRAALPAAGRDASMTFTINDKIYLAGSSASKDFWRYDPAANTWTRLADIPGTYAYRGFAVAFALNGKGYVGMGADTSITSTSRDLWQYDTATNSWTQVTSLPGYGRDGAFTFVINNVAYVGGGNDSTGYLLNDFWAYDPGANSWSRKADLPDYTIFPFAFSIGDTGYISCGQQGAAEVTATYRYDPVSNTWASRAAFPGTARQAGTAFVLNNKAYCAMGMMSYTTAFSDIYTYTPATNSWSLLGNFPAGTDAWPASATANGKAYVGTGWNFGSSFFSYWYQYTPAPAAVNDLDNNPVTVFPNPAKGALYIKGALPTEACTYTLTDIAGRQCQAGKLQPTIDIADLLPGLYVLAISSNESQSETIVVIR